MKRDESIIHREGRLLLSLDASFFSTKWLEIVTNKVFDKSNNLRRIILNRITTVLKGKLAKTPLSVQSIIYVSTLFVTSTIRSIKANWWIGSILILKLWTLLATSRVSFTITIHYIVPGDTQWNKRIETIYLRNEKGGISCDLLMLFAFSNCLVDQLIIELDWLYLFILYYF